jgi:hypothetical protein
MHVVTQLLGRPHGDVVMIPAVDRLARDTTDLLVTRPRHAARRGGPAFAGCLFLIARYCPYEAFYLGLIVVVMHAGADERVEAARRQVERGRARRTRDMDIDVPCAQPGAGLIRRLAIFHKGDDAASLHAEIRYGNRRCTSGSAPIDSRRFGDPQAGVAQLSARKAGRNLCHGLIKARITHRIAVRQFDDSVPRGRAQVPARHP